jgi:hypothetical protein
MLMYLILNAEASEPVLPEVDIEITVLDDESKTPISNAVVNVSLTKWSRSEFQVQEYTDPHGVANVRKRTAPRVFIRVEHPDFYSKAQRLYLEGEIINCEVVYSTNHIDKVISLKRIKSPTPMYVKSVNQSIPKLEETIGFDFIVGDWVQPYGRGKIKDIIMTLSSDKKSNSEFSAYLNMEFPNDGDGIIAVLIDRKDHIEKFELRMNYMAPETGYVPVYEIGYSKKPGERLVSTLPDKNVNYYFRIRTVLDSQGNVVSALYGKIHDPISFSPSVRKPQVTFMYYVNPDSTRNVEFNPEINLFTETTEKFNP